MAVLRARGVGHPSSVAMECRKAVPTKHRAKMNTMIVTKEGCTITPLRSCEKVAKLHIAKLQSCQIARGSSHERAHGEHIAPSGRDERH